MTNPDDRQVIEAQIGRPLRAESIVVSRCHLQLPVVIRVPPILDDGTPFPTLYWLTCPLATARVSRIESSGGVKRMDAKAASSPEFGAALELANTEYAAERDAMVGDGVDPVPTGGIGGTSRTVKCLHAHYAHSRAGKDNPVGALVQEWIEPLDCLEACVVDGTTNPAWVSRP